MKWQDVPRDPICDDDTLEALFELTQSASTATTGFTGKADIVSSLPLSRKKPTAATSNAAAQQDKLA